MDKQWIGIGVHSDYEINDLGELRNRKTLKLIRPYLRDGYHCVRLVPTGQRKRKAFRIHRLVATAFIGIPKSVEMVVNHKDGNRLNNKKDNLEWTTVRENILHARRVTKNGSVLSKKKIVDLYKSNPNLTKDEFFNLLLDSLK